MTRRTAAVLLTVALGFAGCSARGSTSLSCTSTEVAPNSQPGASNSKKALRWYLLHGNSDLPRTGFVLNSHTRTRHVYSDGKNQIAVSALPADPGKPRVWVVVLTYECS